MGTEVDGVAACWGLHACECRFVGTRIAMRAVLLQVEGRGFTRAAAGGGLSSQNTHIPTDTSL